MKRFQTNNVHGIYKITNKVNGKFYIGSAVNIKERWDKHRSDLYNRSHKNPHFLAAWNKYGERNFKFEVIEFVEDKKLLLMREQHWINWFDASKNGYNINPNATSGGNNKIQFDEALLGSMPDYKLARLVGTNKSTIAKRRRALGIKSYAEVTGNTGKVMRGQKLKKWSASRREAMMKWREKSISNGNSPLLSGPKKAARRKQFQGNGRDICTPYNCYRYKNLIKRRA
jgi:group I intron endonuclease